MKRFEYRSENIGGNLHDVTRYMNDYAAKEGWELVTAECGGGNSVLIMKRELPSTED
jgi:hypothetical protein